MKTKFKNMIGRSAKALFFVLFVMSCNPVKEWPVPASEQEMSTYIETHTDKFSELAAIIKETGLDNMLSVRGPYTMFAPNDDAMKAYYTKLGIASYKDLTRDQQIALVYNHLVMSQVGSGDITLGALRDTNALGDYLVTEFSGSDIIVNKSAKIVKRDILVANGFIHEIDQVIEPVKEDIFTKLASNPAYSLFTEGLRRTKLKDTLSLVTFPYGRWIARTRFTVLAVPDSIYNKNGITTADQLVASYTNAPDSVTYLNNGFYRYMEYHCLAGTFYLSDFTTKLYPILSYDNNIYVQIDNDYKLNFDKITKKYTGFILEESNIPAKNGAIHTINDLLPVVEPAPTKIILETTDYLDMRMGSYFGHYYMKWSGAVGQTQFQKIKYEGDYLQYYFKDHDTGELLNNDCLNMNGFWWCQVTIPKIMKGQYSLSGNLWNGQLDYAVFVDGVKTAQIPSNNSGRPKWGDFNWTKTEEHTIKIVAVTWGMMFWDTVELTPIK